MQGQTEPIIFSDAQAPLPDPAPIPHRACIAIGPYLDAEWVRDGSVLSEALNKSAGCASIQMNGATETVPADYTRPGVSLERTGDQVCEARTDAESPGPQVDSAATRDRLVRLAFRFLWDRDEAEDVAQEALIAALRHGGSLRDPDRWWTWLCRIVVHRCHERGRKKLRTRRALRELFFTAEKTVQTNDAPQAAEEKELLRRHLLRLPRRQQEVIVLRHLEGMPYEQIAEVLGVSPSTARVHARAGLETLRKRIAHDAG